MKPEAADYSHIWGDVPRIPPDYHTTMTNHPSRSPTSASRCPTGEEVQAARLAAKLDPFDAGALVHERGTRWMAFEKNEARMHPAAWELFKLKTGQV